MNASTVICDLCIKLDGVRGDRSRRVAEYRHEQVPVCYWHQAMLKAGQLNVDGTPGPKASDGPELRPELPKPAKKPKRIVNYKNRPSGRVSQISMENWLHMFELLASGKSTAEVAKHYNISTPYLWMRHREFKNKTGVFAEKKSEVVQMEA